MSYQPIDREKTEETRLAALHWFYEELDDQERAYIRRSIRPLIAFCKGLSEIGAVELIFVLCRFVDEAEDGIEG